MRRILIMGATSAIADANEEITREKVAELARRLREKDPQSASRVQIALAGAQSEAELRRVYEFAKSALEN